MCCGSPFPEIGLAISISCWVPSFRTFVSGLKFILFSLTARFLVTVSSFLVLSSLGFLLFSSLFCRCVGESLCPSSSDFQLPSEQLFLLLGLSTAGACPSCLAQPSLLLLVFRSVCRPSATYFIISLLFLCFCFSSTSSFSPLFFHIKASLLCQNFS